VSPYSALERFEPVSLEELDRRASLQKRVDEKYIVGTDRLAELFDDLQQDHEVLEVDGNRTFLYRSVYFDTPDLKCLRDHVEGARPRYKLRTRHYVTTEGCVFEVKVKGEDDETSKHSVDHSGAQEDRLDDAALALIDEALGEAGIELPTDVRPTLVTSFERSTLALRGGAERTTIDRNLRLVSSDGESLVLNDDVALLETKTESGGGRADRALDAAKEKPVSFSKYRLGAGRLLSPHDDPGYADDLMPYFSFVPAAADDAAARIFDAERSAEQGVAMNPSPRQVIDP
jgi:hypothetical protein